MVKSCGATQSGADRFSYPYGVLFGNVISQLGARLTPDAIVVLDAGMAAALTYKHIAWHPPQRLLAPITGSMGFGVPAAVAAAMRFPGRQVVLIAGDGGFLMNTAELALAAERSLPIRCIVANNRCYGVIRLHQQREYGDRNHVGTMLSTPDFVKLGEAFGCQGSRIDSEDGIGDALSALLGAPGPALVEVNTSLSAQLQ